MWLEENDEGCCACRFAPVDSKPSTETNAVILRTRLITSSPLCRFARAKRLWRRKPPSGTRVPHARNDNPCWRPQQVVHFGLISDSRSAPDSDAMGSVAERLHRLRDVQKPDSSGFANALQL